MEVETINTQMEQLKAQIKTLSRKKDLAIKNDRYKNDPEFKAKLMLRNREYYQNKIRPNKVFKYKKCEMKYLQKPLVENPLEKSFC
jgi:hypothetical protein